MGVKAFFKKLYQVSQVVSVDDYVWDTKVPPMGKHEFIRNQIRKSFEEKGLLITEVIKKGFHTTPRNAFAHSEYVFNVDEKYIKLLNYSGEKWDIDYLTFDEWTTRFAYSVTLNLHFLNEIHKRRVALIKDFGTNTFVPNPAPHVNVKILYDEAKDSFVFV